MTTSAKKEFVSVIFNKTLKRYLNFEFEIKVNALNFICYFGLICMYTKQQKEHNDLGNTYS